MILNIIAIVFSGMAGSYCFGKGNITLGILNWVLMIVNISMLFTHIG